MTNPIAVSQRALECLATAYEQAGYRDEAAAFRAGDWTCHDHPALVAMVRFEAEIRADATEVERERAVKVADQRVQLLHDLDGPMAQMRAREASLIATAIRNQKDHDHE